LELKTDGLQNGHLLRCGGDVLRSGPPFLLRELVRRLDLRGDRELATPLASQLKTTIMASTVDWSCGIGRWQGMESPAHLEVRMKQRKIRASEPGEVTHRTELSRLRQVPRRREQKE
jgi:hypothetical protein